MELDFSYSVNGLVVSFTPTIEIPSSQEPEWDFGDFTGTVKGTNVIHEYKRPGPFQVTLRVELDGVVSSVTKTVEVTGVITHLPKSIYQLIDLYVPSETGISISYDEKEMYITKWQLYLQPLVNHEIPISRYSDEDYYEALENQLIMELAVYDIISTHITDLILTAGNSLQGYMSKISNSGSDDGNNNNGGIKAITTGPTEVQFYQDLTDSLSTMYKAYSSSVGPGGILDVLKQNLCTLASRLLIFLPFCEVNNKVITPRVVNRRPPSSIIGPNPYKTVLR